MPRRGASTQTTMTSLIAILPLLLAGPLLVRGTEGFNDTNVALNQSLPEGYVAYPDFGVAYRIYNANVSWTEAQERCTMEGAQLAAIDSAQKLSYAMKEPMGHGVRHVGLIFLNDQWITLHGDPALPSIPWAKNQPHSPENGDYAMVGWLSTVNGLINGNRLNFIGDYICEIQLPGSVDPSSYEIPEGYIAYRDIGVAYMVCDTPKSWNIARQYCVSEGADLAVIDSIPKLDYARHQQGSGTRRMHVGIRRVEGQWVRASNGELIPRTLMALGVDETVDEEEVQHGFDCATLEVDALVSASCDDEDREFICEFPLRLPVPESPTKKAPSTIPYGYIAYPEVGVAYKIYNFPTTWTEATEKCNREGAELAVIDTVAKIGYATSQANKYATSIWVGINDPEADNEWVSVIDGASLLSIPWAKDEPISMREFVCAVWKSSTNRIHAEKCDIYMRAYVCELRLHDEKSDD